jgi:hypothetical protein
MYYLPSSELACCAVIATYASPYIKVWTTFRTSAYEINVITRQCYWQIFWNSARQGVGAQDGLRRQMRGGAKSSTTGPVLLGLSRPHSCDTLFQTVALWVIEDEKSSNGLKAPQYYLECDMRANNMHRRRKMEMLGMQRWENARNRVCSRLTANMHTCDEYCHVTIHCMSL